MSAWKVIQLKEYPMSCQLKPTFSSTQDQALHISPLPTSSASSATTAPHTPSQWPSHGAARHSPHASADLCTCSPFFPLDYLTLCSGLACRRCSLPCLGRARLLFGPLGAPCAGFCVRHLLCCDVINSMLPPLPGPFGGQDCASFACMSSGSDRAQHKAGGGEVWLRQGTRFSSQHCQSLSFFSLLV